MKFLSIVANGSIIACCFMAVMLNIKLYLSAINSHLELIFWSAIYASIGLFCAIDTNITSRKLTAAENTFCLFSGVWLVIYPSIKIDGFYRFFDITIGRLQALI